MSRAAAWLGAMMVVGACGADQATDPGDPWELKIVNRTGTTITFVNISPCSSPTWGEDQLDGDIQHGASMGFQVEPGCHDVRVGDDGASAIWASSHYEITLVESVTHELVFVPGGN